MGLYLGHFGFLFGQVHVHRAALAERGDGGKVVFANRAQGVRRDAKLGVSGEGFERVFGAVDQFGETVGVVAKADLTGAKRAAIAAAELVVDREQGQADAGGFGSGSNARGHFGQIFIGRAAGLMVEVVEFHIGGIPSFQHFHLHKSGDGLSLIRRDLVEEAEHELAPCPETVPLGGPAFFGQPGQRALEGVAVAVDRGGKEASCAVAL